MTRPMHNAIVAAVFAAGFILSMEDAVARKEQAVFFSAERVARCRRNADQHEWGGGIRERIVKAAEPWLRYSDDELWAMPFGARIQRSHMVWSDGYCPACTKPVRMYNWKFDPHRHPWKVWCPHCRAKFPTNDFKMFHESGLDEQGVFDPARADRSLLFNAEHPDPADPLHQVGVDDGEGYIDGKKRWRFIGWYLNFAHWTALIQRGVVNLAAAHTITGDPDYAHRAGILLDRLADVWPDFDYRTQGFVYERRKRGGSIRYSIDNCMEIRALAFAYDQVFGALSRDGSLVAFLAAKAAQYGGENTKADFARVQANIEERLFGHALTHPDTIASNYPQPEMTRAVIHTVLDWPARRPEVEEIFDAMIRGATAVDGVSGEKGMVGYGSWAVRGLATFIARYNWVDPDFMQLTFERHPRLSDSWRFFIDVWCFQRFYPHNGDSGGFARRVTRYCGLDFRSKHVGPLDPSVNTFLWDLYKQTGDADYVRVMMHENEGTVDGLPHDLFAEDVAAFQGQVAAVIADVGAVIETGSVNKEDWHLGILRTGVGETGVAAWLDYDAGGAHGQCDGMNIGLYAHGMDFMPEFGYPEVGFGGWVSAKARWYRGGVPSHNTVCVDGKMQVLRGGKLPSGLPSPAAGETTIWADGDVFRVVRASGPSIAAVTQFERTYALVMLDETNGYLVDIFRVTGGKDHAKFQHTQNGDVTVAGLNLEPGDPYICELGYKKTSETVLRNFRYDRGAELGWSVDWAIQPFYDDSVKDAHFRYTDLSRDADAALCEEWVWLDGRRGEDPVDLWLPTVMTRRTTEEESLSSTFVAVMEAYRGESRLGAIRRIPLVTEQGAVSADANVCIVVATAGGGTDILVTRDVEDPLDRTGPGALRADELGLTFVGDLCFLRRRPDGSADRVVLCNATELRMGNLHVRLTKSVPHIALDLTPQQMCVVQGDPAAVAELRVDGKPVPIAP
ncbi:MAG: hypothetical protein HN742_15960 [Lentisphaerae bacterium]|nr:hypothetical protein [Lentisphaerota bacterium]MBT5609000.1 hypothetical protein [Lentisphaerota bacterium]MBT7055823.1 hypothetical protein [Lentisphaerota bacterium]MBT7843372.1 hypothetical protein [Lentisphaerota bacterium]